MFCHNCGAKLVNGAKFCSFCGTLVPEEILSMMQSTSTPVSEIKSEPEQEPIPEPEPTPTRNPIPEPEPISKQEPIPEPEPELETIPESKVVSKQEPIPEPVQVPNPEPEPERITISLTVTSEQLQNGETILINDDRMLAPLALQLSKEMKDGIKMRLSNARMAPASNGAKRELVAHLHVIEVSPQPQKFVEPANKNQHFDQSGTASTSQSNNASGWVQTSQSAYASKPAERKKVLIADSIPCGFLFAKPGKSTDGYHYGGNDGGAVSIYSHQLILYRKSRMVGAAFGVIGSAIEGRGKQYATIPREDVSSFEKRYNKKGRVQDYLLHFKDGRTLKIIYYGKDNSFESAMDQFLQ